MKQQRRLAAIVSIDLAGYSRLMGLDEAGTHAALKALRHDAIDPRIAAHGGRIVKSTGDGLLVEFASVVDAVNSVVEMQRDLAHRAEAQPAERRMQFRMGVNLGDIIIDDDDIFGDGVNIAARLQAIAPPGGVMISEQVFESVANKVDATFADVGVQRLKNIDHPLRTYRWSPLPVAERTQRLRKVRLATPLLWGLLALLLVAGGVLLWQLTGPTPQPVEHANPQPAPTAPQATASTQRIGIAVLPFVNQSGDPSQEYFADGLTEDVISALGRFSSLTVMSSKAVFPYKGKDAKPADIGRELDVQYLVEASVRRSGERIRVNAQLTEAASGRLLWSQQYEDSLNDVFAMQDAISRKVVGALAVGLTKAEQERALAKATDNLDAYDLVLRGRERLRLATRASNREGRQLFNKAIELDASYASAYAWLAEAYAEMADFGWAEDPVATYERAAELTQKALSLDPDDLVALSVLVSILVTKHDYDQALAVSDRLLEINPSDVEGLSARSVVLLYLGRIDEAIDAGERVVRFDPNPHVYQILNLGLAYYEARRHDDAIRLLERGTARFPDNWVLQAVLAAAYAQDGRAADATKALDAMRRLNPFFSLDYFGTFFQDAALQAYLQDGLTKAGWSSDQ